MKKNKPNIEIVDNASSTSIPKADSIIIEEGGKKSLISEFLSLNSIIFCGLIACLPIIGGILVTKYYKIQTKDFEIIQYKEEQGIELTPDEKEFQERYKKYTSNKKEAEKKQGGIFRPRIKKK